MLLEEDLQFRVKLWNDVIDSIHDYFRSKDYLEVRTPLLVRSPGMEPNLDPIGVEVRTLNRQIESEGLAQNKIKVERGGLITSPEYSMKKLLGAGLKKIYTVTPVFRNVEKMGERWSIEFTMLEWYQAGVDYRHGMEQTETFVNDLLGGDISWPRISYVQQFEDYFGVHPADATEEVLRKRCVQKGHKYPASLVLAEQIADLFQWYIQPFLEAKHPRFFLIDYPVAEAALAQKTADGRAAERFEGYVNGLEICNGFTELTNPEEQRERFILEAAERKRAGKEVFPIDEELLSRLSSVPSPTFGNALGVDRLVMLKAGVTDIDSIHLFPPSTRF